MAKQDSDAAFTAVRQAARADPHGRGAGSDGTSESNVGDKLSGE